MLKRIKNSIQSRAKGMLTRLESGWKDYVRYYEDEVIWDNAVLFESFGGKNFQGNPYYLFKEMLTAAWWKEKEFYIAHQNPEELLTFLRNRKMLGPNVHVVLYLSPEYRNILCHAKYLINNMSINMNYIKKDGQVYVNTWHGTPLKTLGRTVKNDPFAVNNPQRNMLLADILLAPNELTKRVYELDHMIEGVAPEKILMSGYPRNTAFFDDELRAEIRAENGLEGKKAIFYMPTWRGSAASGVRNIDFIADMERLAEELGNEYVVYIKLHPAMSGSLNQLHACRTMPDKYEVYEFLNACDVLITDYSSVYFDFANTGRQIILYQYDKKEYYAERGVYPDVERNTPFAVVEDYDALRDEILSPRSIDSKEFRAEFCSFDGPEASEKLLKKMQSFHTEASLPVDLYVIDFPVRDEQLLKWKNMLEGESYRFLFVPKRSNHRFSSVHCFSELQYLSLFTDRNILIKEYVFSHKKAMYREKKRLWGNLSVGKVYTRHTRIPLLNQFAIEKWPERLGD